MSQYLSSLLKIALLLLLPAIASSQDVEIIGIWTFGSEVYPGLSVDADLSLKGKTLRIEENTLLLPESTACTIGYRHSETLRDDMETFGSGGGAWSRTGLVPTGNDSEYDVEIIDLACGDGSIDPVRLIFQAKSNKLLLDVRDGVYFQLERFNPF